MRTRARIAEPPRAAKTPCYAAPVRVVHPADPKQWKKVGKPKHLGDTPWLSAWTQVWRDPHTGRTQEFSAYRIRDWCEVCAFTTSGSLLLCREYKQGADTMVTAFPAGGVGESERPRAAALRELQEETGFRPERLVHVGSSILGGRQSPTQFHSFVAIGCLPSGARTLDDTEDIEVVEVSVLEFWDLVWKHEIREAGTLSTALLAVLRGYLPPPTKRRSS